MPALKVVDTATIDFDQCWATLRSGDFKTSAGVNTLLWGGKKYVLRKDRPVPVPRALINLWMGDPDLRDHPTDGSRSFRADRLRPLAHKWGIDPGGDMSGFPDILVQSFEGEELATIISDPHGEKLAEPDQTALDAAQLIAAQRALAKQAAVLTAMADEMGLDLGEMNVPTVEDAPPVPGPPRLPSSKLPDPDVQGPALAPAASPAVSASSLPEPVDPSAPQPAKKAPAKAKAKPTTDD